MGKKIAKIDADAMDSLYTSEFSRLTGRKNADWQDDKGAPKSEQAFSDHKEYLETLKSVLSSDGSTDFDPNDPTKD